MRKIAFLFLIILSLSYVWHAGFTEESYVVIDEEEETAPDPNFQATVMMRRMSDLEKINIYLPDDMGVRIEDLVIVTEDGCEVINHYPHEVRVLEV